MQKKPFRETFIKFCRTCFVGVCFRTVRGAAKIDFQPEDGMSCHLCKSRKTAHVTGRDPAGTPTSLLQNQLYLHRCFCQQS